MNNCNDYIIFYKKTGEFFGFYNSLDVIEFIMGSNEGLGYCGITPDIKNEILSWQSILVKNPSSITPEVTINSIDLLISPESADDTNCGTANILYNKKMALISEIKDESERYQVYGLDIPVNGQTIHFIFGSKQQSQMKLLINSYKSGDTIYYNADGLFDMAFEYDNICEIYKTLFNNMVYNGIYADVFSHWIYDNYTLEMDESPDVYAYGYMNDEIMEEVSRRYELQKLH